MKYMRDKTMHTICLWEIKVSWPILCVVLINMIGIKQEISKILIRCKGFYPGQLAYSCTKP